MKNPALPHSVRSAGKATAAFALIFGMFGGIFFAHAAAEPTGNSGAKISLDANVTILENPQESAPIQAAEKDFASDFAKVFGRQPRIVYSTQDAGPVTIVIGENSKLPRSLQRSGPAAAESFSISVATVAWNRKQPTRVVLLTGADMRGTIYSIYEFSQKYLGVDPMYYWTDHVPARRSSIAIPAALDEKYPAPVFRYRGFFVNDEDLLTGWAPGEKKDKTGISLAVWNRIDETILRLKGNMVAPGTWIFPNDPQVKLAAERGLIVTQHHAIPLGVNVARWPKGVPYNYTTHPEILERAWKNAVASYLPNQEVLWAVGLRGLSDESYADLDPSVRGNNRAQGRLIGKAIADQMKIVRAVHPDAKFVTALWAEGRVLMHSGDLKIPPEVTTVWSDLGFGCLQDNGQVTAGQGAYYHVAMMSFEANQLTELVPVDRIESELGRYVKAGATQYLLLNTSNIRPFVMTTRAAMDLAWRGVPAGGSAQFYRDWATEEFGAKAAPAVSEIYREYFNAPPHFGKSPRQYGDEYYHGQARWMMLSYMIQGPTFSLNTQSPQWEQPYMNGPEGRDVWLRKDAAKYIQECGAAEPRWDAVWNKAQKAESLVDPSRRQFYQAQVLTMIAINRESNRMLLHLSRAIEDLNENRKADAHGEVRQALDALDAIDRAETAAEYGKWKNWYRGDWLTAVYRTREMMEIFAKYIDDPMTHLPSLLTWDWEAYYQIMHYEGNRSVDVQ